MTQRRFCTACGQPSGTGDRFCGFCGTRLADQSAETAFGHGSPDGSGLTKSSSGLGGGGGPTSAPPPIGDALVPIDLVKWIAQSGGSNPVVIVPTGNGEIMGFVNIESGLIRVGAQFGSCDPCDLGVVCQDCGGLTVPSGRGDNIITVIQEGQDEVQHVLVALTDECFNPQQDDENWPSLNRDFWARCTPALLGTISLDGSLVIADGLDGTDHEDPSCAVVDVRDLRGQAAVVAWLGIDGPFGVVVHALSLYTGMFARQALDAGINPPSSLAEHFSEPTRRQHSHIGRRADDAHQLNFHLHLMAAAALQEDGDDEAAFEPLLAALSWLAAGARCESKGAAPGEFDGMLQELWASAWGGIMSPGARGEVLRQRYHRRAARDYFVEGASQGSVLAAADAGYLCGEFGDLEGAERWGMMAAMQDEDPLVAATAINNVAYTVLMPARRYDEARALLKRGIDLDVGYQSWNAACNMAAIDYEAGDLVGARTQFESLAESAPYFPGEPLYFLIRIALDQGRRDEADRLFERLRDEAPDSSFRRQAEELLAQ